MKLLTFFLVLVSISVAEPLRIAAASSLRFALEEISKKFQKKYKTELLISYGASGHFYLQIKHGAPYDVFLSANATYPRKLVEKGRALKDTYTVFAKGRLVLFTVKDIELKDYSVLLKVKRIALANPKYAPYGKAAMEFLKNAGLYPKVRHKLVYGANVSQAFQFTASGGADIGLVALSLVIPFGKGRWLEVSPELYSPVEHAGVVTVQTKNRELAKEFLNFLKSKDAEGVFKRYGFYTK